MTVWIRTREGGDVSTDSDDYTFIYRFSDNLDSLCNQLGVTTISSFFDSTELEGSMREEETGEASDVEDDELWFDASSGLATFQALRASIAENELPNLSEDHKTWLLDELDDCITKLTSTSEQGGKFNLPIVM